jgi:hypothetical protein
MIDRDSATDSSAEQEYYNLWINDEAFIRVDREGRCLNYCAEGSLGLIVQLLSDKSDKSWALKIPRLVGETHRENAYIVT